MSNVSELPEQFPGVADLSPDMQCHLDKLLKSGFDHDQAEIDHLVERCALYRKLFYILAGLFVLTLIAIIVMLPLKEKVPQIVRVDVANGLAEVVRVSADRSDWDNPNEYWAKRYVLEREQYIHGLRREQYRRVMLLSDGSAAQQFDQSFSVKHNPRSPQLIYGPGTIRKIDIRGYNRVNDDTVIVRYAVSLDHGDNRKPVPGYWAATIHFKYAALSTDPDVLEVNPLGWKAHSYRNDPESLRVAQ